MAANDVVIVTKSKLDGLADTVKAKSGKTGKLTIDQMKTAVANMGSGSGTAPVYDGSFRVDAVVYNGAEVETVSVDGETARINAFKEVTA